MGKKEVFQIVLDKADGVFYPGQMVIGKVDLQLFDEMKVTAINFIAKGWSHVHWSEGSNNNRRHYRNYEKYFHVKMCLFGKEQTGGNDVKLQPGNYSYPFSFQLPAGIAASYEATIGQVRYSVKGHIDIPWALDKYTKRMLTVVTMLDLNTIPNTMNGATNSGQKNLCCLCCKSGPISATMAVTRTGYVPGEAVTFQSEINNTTTREMVCTKAKLVMQVTYHATSKSKTVYNVVNQSMHGKIEGGGTDIWMNERVHIPPVPPSYMRGCNIIDLRYLMMMSVDPAGTPFDLDVSVEVVIGTIPLASIAQQHGITLPPPPPPSAPGLPPPPPGAPQGIYSDSAMPTALPQATLTESAMGRVNVKDDDDDDGSGETQEFAPVYTYYNWDKPDTASMFTAQST